MQTVTRENMYDVRSKVNILIVDDDAKNLLTLKEVLQDLNENVVAANSGKEALQLLLKIDFAVVILDVKLPDIDGYQIARLMRKRYETRETPIIFVTGYTDGCLGVSKGYESGAVDYLIKPIDPKILASKTRIFVELYRKSKSLEFQKELALRELKKNRRLNRTNIELQQRKREAEQFAYIASHDLQSPLRHIISFVEVLRDDFGESLSGSQQEAMDIILKSTQRMKLLISDLLSLSQIGRESFDNQLIDLKELLTEVVENCHVELKDVQADISIESLPKIYGDKSRLRQVFHNLIGNSIKYRSQDVPLQIKVKGEVHNKFAEIRIQDNGIGIDPKHSARVFEIFQRLHTQQSYSGTGIGLSICKKIIELHGGKIWVKPNQDIGSTFHLKIPVNARKEFNEFIESSHLTSRRPVDRRQARPDGY